MGAYSQIPSASDLPSLPERSQWPPHSHWLSWWLPASWLSPPPTSSEVSVDTALECPVWACGELALATDIPALVLAMATDWAAMDSDSVSALPQLLASPLSVWELELAKLTNSNHHPQHLLISDCICLL